jgi:N-acetylmuramoyl-L-alanine amidase
MTMLHSCFDDNYPRDLHNHIQTNLKSNQPRHMSKVIVIDPGHGGTSPVGGSSPNNATALPSGILEKTMTLDMAKRIRSAIAGKTADVEVVLTRSTDVNIGIGDRARTSANNRADLFLSIHFNAFNRVARGVDSLDHQWERELRC